MILRNNLCQLILIIRYNHLCVVKKKRNISGDIDKTRIRYKGRSKRKTTISPSAQENRK